MSSPSSSPSSPLYSPFSLLPFELVEDIIGATLPLYHNPFTYAQRQKTLLSLCLVSRLFHQISKPLLFAVVRIDDRIDCSRFSPHEEEEEVARLPQIRELIGFYASYDVRLEDLTPIFRTQLYLTKLVLINIFGEVDFGTLSQMNHLSILCLANVVIEATSPFILSRLSELSWVSLKPTESWTSNFDSPCFPSLRAVSTYTVPDNASQLNLARKILDAVSPQLEIIAIEIGIASHLSPDLFARIQNKTLVEVDGRLSNSTAHASYLRFRTGLPASPATFANLIRFVKDLPSSTSSSVLYFPLHLRLADTYSTELQHYHQSLLDECSAKKIEVVFEEQLDDWYVFQQISPDFRRRMKAKKVEG